MQLNSERDTKSDLITKKTREEKMIFFHDHVSREVKETFYRQVPIDASVEEEEEDEKEEKVRPRNYLSDAREQE